MEKKNGANTLTILFEARKGLYLSNAAFSYCKSMSLIEYFGRLTNPSGQITISN